MKKILIALTLLCSTTLFAQDYKTGDSELDASMKKVLTEAKKDLTAFKQELSKRFDVGLTKVEDCFKAGMDAADALLAFEIAGITRKPIENVITVYKTNKSKGWGVMAKELGIKPGSAEFHALKGKTKEKSNGKPVSSSNGKQKGNSGKGNGNGKSKK